MLQDNRMNRRPRPGAGPQSGWGEEHPVASGARAPAFALATVVIAALVCASAMSWMYVRYLMVIEAARESRFVNAVVHESGLDGAFTGRPASAMDQLLEEMRRPDLRSVELVSA